MQDRLGPALALGTEAASMSGRMQEALELGEDLRSVESVLRTGGVLGLSLAGQARHGEAIAQFDEVIRRGRELELVPRWTARALTISSAVFRELGAG